MIAPSLPGFGLSFAPHQPRFSAEAMADCLASLMIDALGYTRFGAQGSDWGSFIAARLGYAYPERISGIHLNFLPLRREAGLVAEPERHLQELAHFLREEAGYQAIQGTRPQTLAYGFGISPAMQRAD